MRRVPSSLSSRSPAPSLHCGPQAGVVKQRPVGLPGLTTRAANGKIAEVRVILWTINPFCRKHCSP